MGLDYKLSGNCLQCCDAKKLGAVATFPAEYTLAYWYRFISHY